MIKSKTKTVKHANLQIKRHVHTVKKVLPQNIRNVPTIKEYVIKCTLKTCTHNSQMFIQKTQ